MTNASIPLDYDHLAAEYARHRAVHPGVLANLIATGELTNHSTVLEVGCGTGNYIVALHERFHCTAIGIEPSTEMLEKARDRSAEIAFIPGRADALDVPDATVDLVFTVDVIHHVGNRAAYFTEAYRVLKPGGRLCTATDAEEDIHRRRPLSSHFPETVAVELARYPRIATLQGEMREAGFTAIATEHVELTYDLTTIEPYRDRAFSSLHLISPEAVARGIARLESDLDRGPVSALSLYTLLWGTKSVG